MRHSDPLLSGVTALNDRVLLATSLDGSLRSWRIRDGVLLDTWPLGRGALHNCAVSPNRDYVAVTSLDDVPNSTHPERDAHDRPIELTEGVLVEDGIAPPPLTSRDLRHLHATALSGLGRVFTAERDPADANPAPVLDWATWTTLSDHR